MKTIIVYAHPRKDGFSGYFLEKTIDLLKRKEKEYEVLDLYEMGFNPNLDSKEHFYEKKPVLSDEIVELQKTFRENNEYIFIYPCWWNNVPAILKGFFDRVFTRNYAFDMSGKIPKGLLSGKAIIFTPVGTNMVFNTLFQRNRSINVMRSSLKFCGIVSKGYAFTDAMKLTDQHKKNIRKTIIKGLKYLN